MAQIPYGAFNQSLTEGANMSEWMADGAGEVLRAMENACTSGELHVDDTGVNALLPFETRTTHSPGEGPARAACDAKRMFGVTHPL